MFQIVYVKRRTKSGAMSKNCPFVANFYSLWYFFGIKMHNADFF